MAYMSSAKIRAKEAKSEYDKKYNKENTILKHVVFNRKNPSDMELLDWLMNNGMQMSTYIKMLIIKDREARQGAQNV